jgi:gamma-glutamyltranspeptidase/glutathione hydrolase
VIPLTRGRALRGIFLVALIALALWSCGGAQPATPDNAKGDASRSAEAGETAETTTGTTGQEEPASAAKPASERTAARDPGQDKEPKRDRAGEPELRDGPATTNTARRPALGANGMVGSAHPLATQAGLGVLEGGGNAFDAAVAVVAALNVVEPMMSGVGGYGATVVYDAGSEETRFLETGSRTPVALEPSVFRPPTPGYEENRCGAKVVSTPGNLKAWETMWEEYGELGWARLFEPAVGYAEEGFVIGEETAGWIGSEYPAFPAHAQAIYGREGAPLVAGDRLVQDDLADSLRLVAEEGAGAVYGGELGRAMVSEVRRNGGYLSEDDLDANRAAWRETISVDHRGYEVVTASPPATSWGALVRLGTMGRFDLQNLGHNSTAYAHALTEISKAAFTETRKYAADPPLDRLLSDEYLDQNAASVDFSGVAPFEPPVSFDSAATCSPTGYTPTTRSEVSSVSASASASANAQQHTTHFVVADREGNVVSSTQTLGNVFGSKLMPKGTGIWLNDQLAWSRFEPAGNVFDVFPGRQSLYALCPTIVLRDGRPRIALGTPGGRTISQTTTQMLTNLMDFDMNVQQAVAAPRFSFVIPELLGVEGGIPVSVRGELEALGHDVYMDEYGFGNAHALTIEYGPGGAGGPIRFTGGADPRGEGSAEGY